MCGGIRGSHLSFLAVVRVVHKVECAVGGEVLHLSDLIIVFSLLCPQPKVTQNVVVDDRKKKLLQIQIQHSKDNT